MVCGGPRLQVGSRKKMHTLSCSLSLVKFIQCCFIFVHQLACYYPDLRGFLSLWRVKREKEVARENLWWQVTVVWSYCANQRTRVKIWPWRKTDRCIVIGCLLIDLVMIIDTYRSMIVRFTLPATRGFLLSLLSHSSLFSLHGKRKPLGPVPCYLKKNIMSKQMNTDLCLWWLRFDIFHDILNQFGSDAVTIRKTSRDLHPVL